MSRRIKTKEPGVYYREARRIGGKGTERVYYVVYKKDGKVQEEKVGRQYANDMTPAKAKRIRSDLIEGRRLPRKTVRAQEEAARQEEAKIIWTIDRLWEQYKESRPKNKSRDTDESRYDKYLKRAFGNKEPHEIISLDTDRLRIRLSKKLAPQTVKHVLNLLTWIVNYGLKHGLCKGLSFSIKKPTVNNETTEDLSSEQLERLMAAINACTNIQIANLMKMTLCSGMRRGELFKLRWDDVDFDRGFIWIRDPKGKKDTPIPMNGAAREILKSHPRVNEHGLRK